MSPFAPSEPLPAFEESSAGLFPPDPPLRSLESDPPPPVLEECPDGSFVWMVCLPLGDVGGASEYSIPAESA